MILIVNRTTKTTKNNYKLYKIISLYNDDISIYISKF